MTSIALLKRKARNAYLRREAIFDGLDCGRHMASQLPSYAEADAEFKQAWAKLQELDPSCPRGQA